MFEYNVICRYLRIPNNFFCRVTRRKNELIVERRCIIIIRLILLNKSLDNPVSTFARIVFCSLEYTAENDIRVYEKSENLIDDT